MLLLLLTFYYYLVQWYTLTFLLSFFKKKNPWGQSNLEMMTTMIVNSNLFHLKCFLEDFLLSHLIFLTAM